MFIREDKAERKKDLVPSVLDGINLSSEKFGLEDMDMDEMSIVSEELSSVYGVQVSPRDVMKDMKSLPIEERGNIVLDLLMSIGINSERDIVFFEVFKDEIAKDIDNVSRRLSMEKEIEDIINYSKQILVRVEHKIDKIQERGIYDIDERPREKYDDWVDSSVPDKKEMRSQAREFRRNFLQ